VDVLRLRGFVCGCGGGSRAIVFEGQVHGAEIKGYSESYRQGLVKDSGVLVARVVF
jgi:hypothetical protein